jgi:thymidine phosphorylase
VLLELRTDDESRIPTARDVATSAVTLGDGAPALTNLILDRIA